MAKRGEIKINTHIKKIKNFIPFLILFALLGLFWQQLFHHKHNELPSPLVGKSVPVFNLPNMLLSHLPFSEKNLKGKVSLLNIWATWCSACLIEHPILMKIKNEYHVPIYSIAYKDTPASVFEWLSKHGNPTSKNRLEQGEVERELLLQIDGP